MSRRGVPRRAPAGLARGPPPAMLWRKGSLGADSAAGSRFDERLLTVVASCRQQGRPRLVCLVAAGEAAVRGSPPSLLKAPQVAERLPPGHDRRAGERTSQT
jgi:hypothetical protein